jgi:regulation of enolase protein 1 (concanavalin A-like superfamily)
MDRYQTTRRALLRGAAGTLIAVSATNALLPQAGQGAPGSAASDAAFAHPGLLHSAADLDRMRAAVAAQEDPIYQGFTAMAAHGRSSFEYRIRNTGQVTTWGRGPTDHTSEAAEDAGAAYQNALMWAITGDERHADKARDILDVWSSSLTAITGADGQLGAGIQGFKLVNAAEILRHSGYEGWTEEGIARCERSFKDVWYPSISGHALFANGNWDVAALQLVIAIAVFCDDRVMFEDAVRYAANGAGNGSVEGIVVDESGQGQESGRSQSYAQLAIGLLTDVAEVAWNQGVDLYGHKNDRILAGYEYVSRYNLGEEVAFTPDLDRTGKYLKTAVATGNRGQWRPIHELAYGHYASRMGLAMPYTERVVFRGTGGARFIEGHNDDHPSWGTLTCARPQATTSAPKAPPPAPAGLAAHGAPEGITVSWVGSVEPTGMAAADGYTVKRAALDEDEYEVIATDVTTTSYTDEEVEPGRTYIYAVAAVNEAGTGSDSLGIAVTAGLPAAWEAADIGDAAPAGATDFDGQAFHIGAGGSDIAGSHDSFRFTYLPLSGDGTITARISYPVSSQYAKVGLMMRESLEPDAAHASMLIQGLPLHTWSGVWTTRGATGENASGTGSTAVPPTQQTEITTGAGFPIASHGSLPASATPLPPPYVEGASDGYRWRRPYWVRLRRKGSDFTGWISPDGEHWERVGSSELDFGAELLVGLAVCSVLGADADLGERTSAAFDNVRTPEWRTDAPSIAVGDLRARADASAVELEWSAIDLAGSYTVERAPASGGGYTVLARDIGPIGYGVRARYRDSTGTPGDEYRYVVRAANTDRDGPRSNEVRAVMPTPPPPAIANAAMAFANAGEPFEYLIRAAGDPTGFTATGLPSGLRLDARTGMITGTPTAPGEYSVEVGADNATASDTATLTLTVGTPPPSPWTYRDIGDVVLDDRKLGSRSVVAMGTPGITGHDEASGTFTLRGAGTDLNVINQGMTIHYAFVPLEGDGAITARLAAWSGAASAGRAGLVMAKSLNPFDQTAATVLGANGTVQFFRRPRVAFRPTTTDGPTGVTAPIWLRLSREGDAFSAASSTDGEAWTPIGEPHAIPAFGTAPYYVGLAVVSGDPLSLSTAVFDQVAVTSVDESG